MKNEPNSERTQISVKELKELAIYLSGIQAGKGNLLPLGTVHLDNLWNTIGYLNGDVRFYCEESQKSKRSGGEIGSIEG